MKHREDFDPIDNPNDAMIAWLEEDLRTAATTIMAGEFSVPAARLLGTHETEDTPVYREKMTDFVWGVERRMNRQGMTSLKGYIGPEPYRKPAVGYLAQELWYYTNPLLKQFEKPEEPARPANETWREIISRWS